MESDKDEGQHFSTDWLLITGKHGFVTKDKMKGTYKVSKCCRQSKSES